MKGEDRSSRLAQRGDNRISATVMVNNLLRLMQNRDERGAGAPASPAALDAQQNFSSKFGNLGAPFASNHQP
jgi:hypothetical protein